MTFLAFFLADAATAAEASVASTELAEAAFAAAVKVTATAEVVVTLDFKCNLCSHAYFSLNMSFFLSCYVHSSRFVNSAIYV